VNLYERTLRPKKKENTFALVCENNHIHGAMTGRIGGRTLFAVIFFGCISKSCPFSTNVHSQCTRVACGTKFDALREVKSNRLDTNWPSSSQALTRRMSSESDFEEVSYDKNSRLAGILVLLTVPLSWGTYGPVVRYMYAIQPPVPGFVFSACYYSLAAVTTVAIASFMRMNAKQNDQSSRGVQDPEEAAGFPLIGGIELGSYLFIANCLQVLGLRTVESDRAGFLVQLTTVLVPVVEALFAQNLSAVPKKTWVACVLAFAGLFIMGVDGKDSSLASLDDPLASLATALSSFTGGDCLIIGAAVFYTLHVVRLGTYARETSPIELAASKATVETIFSILLVLGLTAMAPLAGQDGGGLVAFAADNGKEISEFFSSFSEGLSDGSISNAALIPTTGAIFWTGWVTCAYTIFAQSFGQARVR
jgi:drug/metabolite transporter (DMT)-like permease